MLIEFTLPAGSPVLIEAADIGEVRDLSRQPSRDLTRWGRTLIRHRTFRGRQWNVANEYAEVKRRLAEAIEAIGAARKD